MTDHALIAPTSAGPVGAIVSEPEGETRAALVMLQGDGEPCRAGVNASWSRLSRHLAERGVSVLRFDFPDEGESMVVGEGVPRGPGWRRKINLAILRELTPWLRERAGVEELLLAGSCYGARIAMDFAAEDSRVSGVFLVVPYLWNEFPSELPAKLRTRSNGLPRANEVFDRGSSSVRDHRRLHGEVEAVFDTTPLAPDVIESGRRALRGASVSILTGEGDNRKPMELRQSLGESGDKLNIEVVPDMILHPVTHPEVLDLVVDWLTERVLEHVPS